MKSITSLLCVLGLVVATCAQQLPSATKPPTPDAKVVAKPDCQSAVTMVRNFLEHSKHELIKHIRAANQHVCSKQVWKRVDRSMISHAHHISCKHQYVDEKDGGLRINVEATDKTCGANPNKVSEFAVHLKGNWKQIMFTQVFEGSSRCWAIFGNHNSKYHGISHAMSGGGLEVFSKSHGDVIVSQQNMNSLLGHNFDGRSNRCDDDTDNFWHSSNGSGERRATVIMRRKAGATMAGLYTGVYCGTPKYSYRDIYVLT